MATIADLSDTVTDVGASEILPTPHGSVRLSDRKKGILKAVVDAYIDTGEPVGSKNLASYGNISLSPATIRNEMSELESMGYLEKPHTSAGRVPSALAYKLYVDELQEDYRLGLEELELLGELTKAKSAQVEGLIERAAKIISGVTKYAAVSISKHGQGHQRARVSRFETVFVNSHSLLLVMILEDGNAKSCQLTSELTLTGEEVSLMKEILTAKLCGISLDKVSLDVIMELEDSFGKHRALVGRILRAAYSVTRTEPESDIKIDGLTNLLSYPEFSTVEKARSIVELAESRRDEIKRLLETEDEPQAQDGSVGLTAEGGVYGEILPEKARTLGNGLKILIGDGDAMGMGGSKALSDTSIVYCSFPMGETDAVIGILGPKRMDYKKVVASLKYLASSLSDDSKDHGELPGLESGIDREDEE